MLNSLKRQILLNINNNVSLNLSKSTKREFSVFAKLKDYLRSGAQSTVTMFGSNIDPEKIKVEIDDDLSSKKTKIKGSARKQDTIQYSEAESKLIDQLPKQIISNYNK